jgi:hypothetical protein
VWSGWHGDERSRDTVEVANLELNCLSELSAQAHSTDLAQVHTKNIVSLRYGPIKLR